MNSDEIKQQNKKYTMASWMSQGGWNPLAIEKANGIYYYDFEGNRFIDWASQLINVNIGHSHPKVIQAIKDQAEKLCYISPSIATEARGKLGKHLADITPANINKSLFTTGGADAIENAIKIARLYTGRNKIVTRYKSYHGGTAGAMTA